MGSRNKAPPIPPYTTNVIALVALNWVEANRPSGSIGAAIRRSCQTKAPSSATPPSSAGRTAGLVQ